MNRDYLQVTPTSAHLDPDTISTALGSLWKLSKTGSDGTLSRLNPIGKTEPLTFEFVAISEGKDEPVEFYYGADERLDVLHQRLRTIYPPSFDIDRDQVDLVEKLLEPVEIRPEEVRSRLEQGRLYDTEAVDSEADQDGPIGADGGTIHARPSLDDIAPYGVRWRGTVGRRKDWMTSLTDFSEMIGENANHGDEDMARSGRAPLAPLIDQLTEAAQPLAYQVAFQRKPDWSSDARRRSGALLAGQDTLLQKFLAIDSPGPRRSSHGGTRRDGGRHRRHGGRWSHQSVHRSSVRDRERDQTTETRLDQLRANTPKRTFTANARLLALPTDDDLDELEARLDALCAVFDTIDGSYYEIEGERLRERGLLSDPTGRRPRNELERFRTRSIAKRRRDRIPRPTNRSDSRPDLVLNADELANLVVVPSAANLTVEGNRGTRAEQQSRNPLPRPDHEITRQLQKTGLELGHLLDENREPEEEPLRLPPDLLPFHVGRFAQTGAGKSIALINDALSVYEQTSGPVFIIDTKGGGLPEHYMRAHAKRFGLDDLEEHVVHFDIPERLPGFAFFNIQPALANGVPRLQAIKDRVDHYEEVLKMTMGEERYEQAVVSPNLLKYLIRLMYDEEYGLEHGRYRESVDYFGQSHLEQVVDQLYDAGPPGSSPEDAPQSSRDEVTSKIHRHLTADPRTFANIMGGVSNRMDYITADPFLRRIFDTTEPRFDMRDVLDEDVVVIFDLGDLRSDAAKVMAGVILTNLYDAVTERTPSELAARPDDYVANLLIDEASSIVVSEVLNDLLEQGREFKLSVELVSQFPEQMELEGDRQVYLNVLNNIGSPIVGKIAVDDEIARALAHEDMDPVAFRNRVRALPRGEWIAQVPSPAFGETGPMPFSVDPLPIPDGHPESEEPLAAYEERRFRDALDTVHERTQAAYGVPVDSGEPTARVPDAIQDALELTTDGLDELLAVITRYVQLREGVRETNGSVSVRAVDDLLETWYDARLLGSESDRAEDEEGRDVPSREDLAEIRERSPLFELSVDTERGETMMRLTETGERTSEPATGAVQAAGGAAHDDALARVEAEFTRAGYLIAPVRQDGSAQPDAWAVHSDAEVPLAIEVETTTYTKPAKVLTNLRRAQQDGVVPLFVVPPGESNSGGERTAVARRVANILEDPVKERTKAGVVLYTGTGHVTFDGGSQAENGVTAARPVVPEEESPSNRTRWRREGDEYVLADEAGTEHARVSDIDAAPKEQFPATFSVDPNSGKHTVRIPGELPRSYESAAAFREEWVPVKRPFLPEVDLPAPEYGRETYAIVLLPDGDHDAEQPTGDLALYEDGQLVTIERLTEALRAGEVEPAGVDRKCSASENPTASASTDEGERLANPRDVDDGRSSAPEAEDTAPTGDADAGVAAFATERLVESEGNVIPFREVYDAYEAFLDTHRFEAKPDNHFTRVVKEELSVESTRRWLDGKARQCYVGVDLAENLDGEIDGAGGGSTDAT